MKIQKSILKTICYFDLFDYPLTLEEVHFYLWDDDSSLDRVRKNMRKMIGGELGRKGTFFFLKGREETVKIRGEREMISRKKWKKAKIICRFLKITPFVRMIAVCNSLAINNAKEESDIDMFIIARDNRLWTVRFLTKILKIFGQLEDNKKKKNKICLSFFVAESNLSLKDIKIDHPDIYLHYWISQIKPLYGKKIYKKFIDSNYWIEKELSNISNAETVFKYKSFMQLLFELILFPFTGFVEKFCKKIEIKKITKNKKDKVFTGSDLQKAGEKEVIANNFMIKLFDPDKRKFYQEKYNERIKKYESSIHSSISST